jgi:ABC-type phosphate transport system substrate-binding protein
MSAFKQKAGKLGVRAGILAGASAAILAISGLGASSALATPSCITGVQTLKGQGSTLQREAQEKWIAAYKVICNPATKTTFSYTGTGSGAALKAFGYSNLAFETEWAYVGTDEAPTVAQIANSKGKANGSKPVIIPVAQTAIAVVANMPAGCALAAGKGLTYADLNKLFAGTIKKWSQISTVNSVSACVAAETGEITRVVRKDSSGTTYQFKNYLSNLETTQSGVPAGKIRTSAEGVTPVTCTAGSKTWASIRANEGTPEAGAPNTLWPENDCNGAGVLTTVSKVEGGGGVANAVATTPNTIGYAALPDAKAKSAPILMLQDGKSGKAETPTYGSPVAKNAKGEETKEANCAEHTYVLPSGTAAGVEVNWSETFGAVPTIGSPFYPLCTLTFDLGFEGYVNAKFPAGTGADVKDYILKYVLEETEGQKVLGENYYQKLPTNVLGAAVTAAGKLTE